MLSPDNKHEIPIQIANFVDDITIDNKKLFEIIQAVIAELIISGEIVSFDTDET